MTVALKACQTSTNTPDITKTLQFAEETIEKKGGRFTPIRKYIYTTLLKAPKPLGAYEIINFLDGVGSQKPPTAYRALAWLIDVGLVAKISYNSRYTPTPIGIENKNLAFLICSSCGSTKTLRIDKLMDPLLQTAKDRGFKKLNMIVEIIGQCCGENLKEAL